MEEVKPPEPAAPSRTRSRQNRSVDELEAENDRLRELASAASKLAEFGRFAAEQNHELRQPLLAIKGLAQLLLDKDALDVAEVHESAQLIVEQSNRMAQLISELRLLSVPRRAPALERTNIADIVRRAVALLDYRLRKRTEVLVDIADDVPLVAAAGDQVEQIVINLLANALDAVAHTSPSIIQIRCRRIVLGEGEGAHVNAGISIADNGSGVSASARQHLFEAFFTTKSDSGTGLGLALSREIARGFSGDLEIVSGADSWPKPANTVFRLTLPAAE